MGQAKREWMESQELEPMYEWIEENFGDDAGEEGSKEWNKAVEAFHEYCEEQARLERIDREQDEYDYYLHLTLGDADSIFYKDISELKDLLSAIELMLSPTLCKMIYAHAVTILEVYLEDIVKSLIASSDTHLNNAIKNVRPFSEEKFKLSEIVIEDDGIRKFVIGKLSENVFHDIPKVVNIIRGVLNKKVNVRLDEICSVTSKRHDIVHRNGKNRDGEVLPLNGDVVKSAIGTVEKFAYELRSKL
ncbi:HEPN domain-containing protein [Marinimicrobium sp. C6131]|uniref:HEPN domain-containing protein n=1 Tax=Marinimicrobium sp. C6131 TaxID=3022676 RepID=UPI00223C9FE0|nr:HEPN domain-containing protein [Marinimicrobium sp. C6131]UZJ45811.1 HEPN domain-containing protein [Marinimicrobium sp. C6131]